MLVLSNDAMYKLAEKTASYRERNTTHEKSMHEIYTEIRDSVVPLEVIRFEAEKTPRFKLAFDEAVKFQDIIRSTPDNKLIQS